MATGGKAFKPSGPHVPSIHFHGSLSSPDPSPWGMYHSVTCKRGGDVTLRHNAIRDVHLSTLCNAGLSSHLEVVNISMCP